MVYKIYVYRYIVAYFKIALGILIYLIFKNSRGIKHGK